MSKTIKCVLINVDVVLISEIVNIMTDTDDMSGASCKLINPYLFKKVKDSDNIEEIKKAIEDLSKASHGFATRMYQEAAQAQQTQQGEATAESNETKDDVQDAEVVD